MVGSPPHSSDSCVAPGNLLGSDYWVERDAVQAFPAGDSDATRLSTLLDGPEPLVLIAGRGRDCYSLSRMRISKGPRISPSRRPGRLGYSATVRGAKAFGRSSARSTRTRKRN